MITHAVKMLTSPDSLIQLCSPGSAFTSHQVPAVQRFSKTACNKGVLGSILTGCLLLPENVRLLASDTLDDPYCGGPEAPYADPSDVAQL